MKKILYLAVVLILFSNTSLAHAQAFKEFKSCPCASHCALRSKSIDNLVGNFDNKIKIIFSDIDGTLIPLDKKVPEGTISTNLKQSVQRLKQAQIPLILVTGRSSQVAKEIAKKMGNENTYIIAMQGAEILNPNGRVIYSNNLNSKEIKKILKEIELFNKSSNQNSKIFFFVKGKPYSNENTGFPYLAENITIFKSFNEFDYNFTSSKMVLYEENTEKLKLIQSHLKKKFPDCHINMSTDCTCDITNLTATKGNAVKRLADILNLDLKNSAIFGDSENDISMLKEVRTHGGLAIAVDNAMTSVKSNSDFITSSVYENGFSKAVNKILENNARLKNFSCQNNF